MLKSKLEQEDLKSRIRKILKEKEGIFEVYMDPDTAVSSHLTNWAKLINNQVKNRFLNEPNTPETQRELEMFCNNYLQTHMEHGVQIDNKNFNLTFTPDMPADSIIVNIDGVQIYK